MAWIAAMGSAAMRHVKRIDKLGPSISAAPEHPAVDAA